MTTNGSGRNRDDSCVSKDNVIVSGSDVDSDIGLRESRVKALHLAKEAGWKSPRALPSPPMSPRLLQRHHTPQNILQRSPTSPLAGSTTTKFFQKCRDHPKSAQEKRQSNLDIDSKAAGFSLPPLTTDTLINHCLNVAVPESFGKVNIVRDPLPSASDTFIQVLAFDDNKTKSSDTKIVEESTTKDVLATSKHHPHQPPKLNINLTSRVNSLRGYESNPGSPRLRRKLYELDHLELSHRLHNISNEKKTLHNWTGRPGKNSWGSNQTIDVIDGCTPSLDKAHSGSDNALNSTNIATKHAIDNHVKWNENIDVKILEPLPRQRAWTMPDKIMKRPHILKSSLKKNDNL
ncbi:unnamed protein product [Owenia fusiformis]|uniref:Uncharacterized protein n=1 Tax=Owenia fusiformis TaxID=6347 RepID=A0A8S4N397_OWEFU|nr:unnamed protein product [Owenia fusiformis]